MSEATLSLKGEGIIREATLSIGGEGIMRETILSIGGDGIVEKRRGRLEPVFSTLKSQACRACSAGSGG